MREQICPDKTDYTEFISESQRKFERSVEEMFREANECVDRAVKGNHLSK